MKQVFYNNRQQAQQDCFSSPSRIESREDLDWNRPDEVEAGEGEYDTIPLPLQVRWTGYQNRDATDVVRTFSYLFEKFHQGIYMAIRKNTLHAFVYFENKNFTNEWSDRISFDPTKYNGWRHFFETIYPDTKMIEWDNTKWTCNNGLIQVFKRRKKQVKNFYTCMHMFHTLCESMTVPDIECFINRRDFPQLTRDGTEPFQAVWGKYHPLVSHCYDRYTPVLSMCSTPVHADIPIPTWADWGMVMERENIFFPASRYTERQTEYTPWDEKKELALFRGTTTGLGHTSKTNPRLKVVEMGLEYPEWIDAKFVSKNPRVRMHPSTPFLDTVELDERVEFAPYMGLDEQQRYKYIINVEGHVAAFRLTKELMSGSLVLMVESDYQLWYNHLLVPFKHYIPIQRDYTDLIEKINWCREHDQECVEIVQQAQEFARTYFTKEKMLLYLQNTLYKIATPYHIPKPFHKPKQPPAHPFIAQQTPTDSITLEEWMKEHSNLDQLFTILFQTCLVLEVLYIEYGWKQGILTPFHIHIRETEPGRTSFHCTRSILHLDTRFTVWIEPDPTSVWVVENKVPDSYFSRKNTMGEFIRECIQTMVFYHYFEKNELGRLFFKCHQFGWEVSSVQAVKQCTTFPQHLGYERVSAVFAKEIEHGRERYSSGEYIPDDEADLITFRKRLIYNQRNKQNYKRLMHYTPTQIEKILQR